MVILITDDVKEDVNIKYRSGKKYDYFIASTLFSLLFGTVLIVFFAY